MHLHTGRGLDKTVETIKALQLKAVQIFTGNPSAWRSADGSLSAASPMRPIASAALARMGRMNLTLRLPDLSAASVGELLMFFQIAAGYAGAWYGVDPFDQPGVELGKRLTYAAMGRPGYESEPAEPADGDEI